MFKNLIALRPVDEETRAVFKQGLIRDVADHHEFTLENKDELDLGGIDLEDLSPFTRAMEVFRAKDPLEHEFVSLGLGSPKWFAEQQILDLNGNVILLSVEKRERRLESSIIQRATDLRVDELEAREHRGLNKREIAGIKHDVVNDLLPKAFIKVKHTLVAITPDYLFIGTGSIKEADDIVRLLRRALWETAGLSFRVTPFSFNNEDADEHDWLSKVLVNGQDDTARFKVGHSVAFKGTGTARFKDVELTDDEINQHTGDKNVISLELAYGEYQLVPDSNEREFQPDVLFDLTDQLVLKRIRFSDIIMTGSEPGDDLVSRLAADAAIVIPTLTGLLNALAKSADVPLTQGDLGNLRPELTGWRVIPEDTLGAFPIITPDEDEL